MLDYSNTEIYLLPHNEPSKETYSVYHVTQEGICLMAFGYGIVMNNNIKSRIRDVIRAYAPSDKSLDMTEKWLLDAERFFDNYTELSKFFNSIMGNNTIIEVTHEHFLIDVLEYRRLKREKFGRWKHDLFEHYKVADKDPVGLYVFDRVGEKYYHAFGFAKTDHEFGELISMLRTISSLADTSPLFNPFISSGDL